MKGSFYEKLEYHMKILLGDFKAKVVKEGIFKTSIGNGILHEICNNKGVRAVNFATSKILSKVQCSHIVKFINLLGQLLMERLAVKLNIF
jgi:hypothetical protein